MEKFFRIGRAEYVALVVLIFVIGFGAALIFVPNAAEERIVVTDETVIEMGIPAVDADGEGVVGSIKTIIRPGTGQILVNVNNVLAQFDTQLSGRTAAIAASDYTEKSLDNVDIIYDIRVNASVIEGPSAGASMAASIVLALEGIKSDPGIMMTGTINEDGTVGRVGAIVEKAVAAKDAGAYLFLVPENQASQLGSSRSILCSMDGELEICRIEYTRDRVSLGDSVNITLNEVRDIGDIVNFYRNPQI